ncbi:MAG: DUF2723 domain-containing protein [Anaerolineales bacterium]
MSARSMAWIAVAIAGAALLVYLLTLAPGVGFTDSGELAVAAYTLGIPHSPGFPLYVLLGWVFGHIPLGSVAWRLNLMSAVWAAAAVGAFFVLAYRLLPQEPLHEPAPKREAPRATSHRTPPSRIVAAGCAALCLAFGITLWNWATVAEVYALQVAVLVGMLLALFAALRGGGRWTWGAAGLCFGLGLANHHVMTLVFAPALLFLLLAAPDSRRAFGRGWLPATLGAVLGLALYLYLPIRAAQGPLLNWGNPVNLQRFVWHITGRQYQVNLFAVPLSAMLDNLAFGLRLWWGQFTPLGFLLAAWGFLAMWRRDRRLALFCALVVLVDVAFASHYDIAEDSDAYYIPTFLMTALGIAWGAHAGLAWVGGRSGALPQRRRGRGEDRGRSSARRPHDASARGRGRASYLPLAYAALALLVALNIGLHWRQSDKHRLHLPEDYAAQALAELEPNATFLTRDWQVYSPLLYFQHVEGQRPDARIVDVELLRRTWYLDYLARQYPDLIARCRAELDAYREHLYRFEYGLPYDPAAIQERYIALLNAFIREGQPAHVGLDMEAGVGSDWVGVPLGVTIALRQDDAFQPFDTAGVRGRGLADGTIHVDAVVRKIRRSYAAVRTYRGVYLARHGFADEALRVWSEAALLDPEYSLPHRLAGDLYAQAGRVAEARAAYLRALAVNPNDAAAQQGLQALGGTRQ